MRRLAWLSLDRPVSEGLYLSVAQVGFRQLLTSYGRRSTLGPGSLGLTGRDNEIQGAVGPAGLIIPFSAKDHNNTTGKDLEYHLDVTHNN